MPCPGGLWPVGSSGRTPLIFAAAVAAAAVVAPALAGDALAQEPPGRGVFDTLNGPTDVVAFEMGGGAYALVTAAEDGVQLVRIHGNGTIEPAGSARHGSGGFDTLRSPNGADAFEMGGNTYAMVAADRSAMVQGVQLVRIHGDGTLEPDASAVHGSGGFTLRHAQSVDAFEMGGSTYAAVTS